MAKESSKESYRYAQSEVREWNGFRFKVKAMDGVRVAKILITRLD